MCSVVCNKRQKHFKSFKCLNEHAIYNLVELKRHNKNVNLNHENCVFWFVYYTYKTYTVNEWNIYMFNFTTLTFTKRMSTYALFPFWCKVPMKMSTWKLPYALSFSTLDPFRVFFSSFLTYTDKMRKIANGERKRKWKSEPKIHFIQNHMETTKNCQKNSSIWLIHR